MRTQSLFHYGKDIVEIVRDYKYLGVVFDEKLKFEKCNDILCNSVGRALGAIIAKFKELNDLGYKIFKKPYESTVIPILDYGSEVWGMRMSKNIDNVQNKAIRFFLGVHKYAFILAINGEMGWLPTLDRRAMNVLRYWNRLIRMNNNRLPKKLFEIEYLQKTGWYDDERAFWSKLA